jgi:hypothetical protein
MFKYANDANLLVPERTKNTTSKPSLQPFKVGQQKMIINFTKTKEIVYHQHNPQLVLDRIPLPGIEIVNEMK